MGNDKSVSSGPATGLPKDQSGQDDPAQRLQSKRERFAKQLTRSVFRRHYWDDRLEREFIAARRKKPNK